MGAIFEPIEPLRSHEYVAEQIRRQIGLHLIRRGETLPSERDLAGMFGVGRATVEAALRILESERLVATKRGRHGGTFVTSANDDGLSRDYLLARLRRDRTRIRQALTFRNAVEPLAASLAARFGKKADVARIVGAAEEAAAAEDDRTFMGADTEFHLAIARAAHNGFVYDSVERVRLVLNDVLAALPASPVWHERTLVEHAPILAAISGRKLEAAADAMSAHLASTEKSIAVLLRAL